MIDVGKTLISQYANSPRILQLIENMNDTIDPTSDIDTFYSYVWDLETAQGFGLDIWGLILGVNRVLNVAAGSYFGFTGTAGRTGASGDSFGGGPTSPAIQPWYSGAPTTSNYALTDTAYRSLLLAKAAYNITDGSIPAINQLLINLFITPVSGRTGNAYVTDGGNMTMTYTFSLTPKLTNVEYAIISQANVLPTPAGVSATIVQS